MTTEQTDSATWYLRMFSYLLMLCGVFGCITGIVVIYQAFAESAPTEATLSLAMLALGVAAVATSGITLAAGIVGRIASRNPRRLSSLYTVAMAGIVGTVVGLGLCYATGDDLPTSLIFNLFLMGICLVVTNNLRKDADRTSA
ncbi:hypothetical protein [Adlercreutzia mucosicola]|uniref:hypothetical protein n=1 Tax=Adlercreutzia mucosicola TaxID=580026 RepID=UPI000407D5FD|nr:hypothetical protein [Adlercreutzia mucosicola]MCR2034071.1 hypothetical protein [Adlercreutzia mucosicola]MEB1814167.1 hypothetical protein [Adlercreutzia mucosicola]